MSDSTAFLPIVVNDHQISLFNFYHDGLVRQGMSYRGHLFGKAYAFNLEDRTPAFEFANQLAATGAQTVIAVSQREYIVWIRLHADEYPYWDAMVKGLLNSPLNSIATCSA